MKATMLVLMMTLILIPCLRNLSRKRLVESSSGLAGRIFNKFFLKMAAETMIAI